MLGIAMVYTVIFNSPSQIVLIYRYIPLRRHNVPQNKAHGSLTAYPSPGEQEKRH